MILSGCVLTMVALSGLAAATVIGCGPAGETEEPPVDVEEQAPAVEVGVDPLPVPVIVVDDDGSGDIEWCETGEQGTTTCLESGPSANGQIREDFTGNSVTGLEGEYSGTSGPIEFVIIAGEEGESDLKVEMTSSGLRWYLRPSSGGSWIELQPTTSYEPSEVPSEFTKLDPSAMTCKPVRKPETNCATVGIVLRKQKAA